ncbi:MAG: NAD-dependent epimerase/dehydratase [Ilumatobacteraceae bacterium]|jgi:CDP-paratose 2-epimerase|nr:NAD-dependent epimerase/dehydratase [Ilumatobacteraceae bacterium]
MTFADRTVLVTGGAGFIGTNVATRVLRDGGRVVVLDDLSRAGVRENLRHLTALPSQGRLRTEIADVRDRSILRRALHGVDTVVHLAAQVAVTTSVDEPRHDFEVNLGGTFALLDEIRGMDVAPSVLYTSTNKVYGEMGDLTAHRRGDRWEPTDAYVAEHGISESRPLSFCSPYGCSKGGADQYVIDAAKTYRIPTVVFRMSCIYGPHQRGNEDQGWVAHFLLQAMAGKPITIFGDGAQVRDALFIDDLVEAMDLALTNIDRLSGRVFNMGGGPENTTSLLELLAMIGELEREEPVVSFDAWRIGDQRSYVSDVRAFAAATGWTPNVDLRTGVARLHRWLDEHAAAASRPDAG